MGASSELSAEAEVALGPLTAFAAAMAAGRLGAVAVLAATGWERQLTSHLIGARRQGAPRATIQRAFRTGRLRAAPAARVRDLRAWREAFGREPRRGTDRRRRDRE